MRWIDVADLENWASRRDSEEYLPLVIRRLIRATLNQIKSISFPAGESIVCQGWDGRLESNEETEYIPKGLSLWEVSTRKDIGTKAKEDYEKRFKNPLTPNPSEATFIFVTPKIWEKKDDWIKKMKQKNFWGDVRVYDARDLEEWLEQAPAVGAWLADHIGKYPGYVQSIESWWNEWSQTTSPPFTLELILAGRKEQVKEIEKWLNADPSPLSVQAPTKDEAIAFLASTILTLPEEAKEHFLSKAIVIPNEESFRRVVATCKNRLLLIPQFEKIEITVSYRRHHHVFIPVEPATQCDIILPRLGKDDFITALVKTGINEEDAERYSKDTARSLTVLRRLLGPFKKQPEWAKPEKAREIVPALFAGKWSDSKDGDKEIVSEIARCPYDEYIGTLKKWLYQPDPPLLKIGGMWRLASPLDAFFALSPFLTKADFDKLKEISLKVFRVIDPSLDLEPKERWMTSVYVKESKYSNMLREGIAETLVLMGTFGARITSLDLLYSPQTWVDSIVRELLSDAEWKLWYSLSYILPLIAEASPLSFLDAVDDSLSRESPPIMKMFSETDDSLVCNSAHPNLLRALECLAWDPNLLGRVTLILAKLARLDPGGKLANRPMGTLRSIFLLWHPHTYATLKEKLEAIDTLISREPKIGWKLLISLIPRSNDSCFPTYKPRWRQFSQKTDSEITMKEYVESISAVVNKILENVGKDGKKWAEFVECYLDLPSQERKNVLDKLIGSINLIEDSQHELWNQLREILSKHRSCPEASWSLPENELKEIERIYFKLEPCDLIKQYLWLFDEHWPNLPDAKESDDHEKYEQIVEHKKIGAVQDIKNNLGLDGLVRFAVQAKDSRDVGAKIAMLSLVGNNEDFLLSFLNNADGKKVLFAQGYVWQRSLEGGDVWIENVIDMALYEQWPSEKVINLFLALPQNSRIWELLEEFDLQIQEEYWKRIQPRLFRLPRKDKIYALQWLKNVKRLFTALNCAALFAKEIPPKLISELLEKAALEKSIDNLNSTSCYRIGELFDILDQSEEIGNDEIANLEWLYLYVLTGVGCKRHPKFLHHKLSNEPEFFAEVIRCLYKPRNEGDSEEEEKLPQELKEQRARLAWELLRSWKTIPGGDNGGSIDYLTLSNWVYKARNLCKELDRLEACDNHIGQTLAHAMPDGEGNWPPEEVCKIIDEIGSKELKDGFLTGVYNKRGVVSRYSTEGGEQERALAGQFQEYAAKWANRFPRTSAILRRIAKTYENEAKREDIEAELRDVEW